MHLTFEGDADDEDVGTGDVGDVAVDVAVVCVIGLVAEEDSSRGPCVVVLPSVVAGELPLCKSLSIALKLPAHSSRPESEGCTQTSKSGENTVPGPHLNSYAFGRDDSSFTHR